MKNSRIFGLDKNIFYIGATSFFSEASTKMVYSILPLFLLSNNFSKTYISLIDGILKSISSMLAGFAGIGSDKLKKRKPFMIIGYAIMVLSIPMFLFVRLPFEVLFVKFFERTGKSIRSAPRDGLLRDSMNKEEVGKSFGFYKAMDYMGTILGALIAFALLSIFPLGYSKVFIFAIIPGLLAVLTIIFFIREHAIVGEKIIQKINLKNFSAQYYLFIVISVVFTLGNVTNSLVLIRATEVGIPKSFVPLIFLLLNFVPLLFSIPLGRLSDRYGRKALLIISFLMYSIAYFLFGRYNVVLIFLLASLVYGIFASIYEVCQKAMISDLVPMGLLGTGYGIHNAVLGITALPASFLAGKLSDDFGSSTSFYLGLLLGVLSTFLMLFLKPNQNVSNI